MAIAAKFDEKAGTSLPSIKKRLTDQGKPKELSAEERDDVSILSMLSGSQHSKVEVETDEHFIPPITTKRSKDPENATRVLSATQSLKRLTLPTPETKRHMKYVQSKCEKFSSFDILEQALKQSSAAKLLSADEKKELLQRRQVFRKSFSSQFLLDNNHQSST